MKGGGERKETCWDLCHYKTYAEIKGQQRTHLKYIYIYNPGSHVICRHDWSGGKVLATLVWFVTEYIQDQQEPIREHKTGKCGTKPKGKNLNNLFFLFGPMESEHQAKIGFDNLCDCVHAALGNSANWHFSDIATLRSLHTIKFYFFL